MNTLRNIFSILLFTCSSCLYAKPQYVFQSENPIANFAWDENDTSRYDGHFRYEKAYEEMGYHAYTTEEYMQKYQEAVVVLRKLENMQTK